VRELRIASQRVMALAADELDSGRDSWFISVGSSMTPAIKVVQRVALRPVGPDELLIGNIVLAKVDGRFWLHRVSEERDDAVHIVADNGMVNGWAPRSDVSGVVDRPQPIRSKILKIGM
jgi:hypothetical protein